MLKKAIRGEVASKVEEYMSAELTDYFLIDVTCHEKSGHIRVYIDGDHGVQFDVLRQVSRYLESWLDEREDIPEAYELEVSSPGAKRPLRLARQYRQHVGRTLQLQLADGGSVEVKLLDVEGDVLSVVEQPKGKNKRRQTPEPQRIELDNIKEAKVKIAFG